MSGDRGTDAERIRAPARSRKAGSKGARPGTRWSLCRAIWIICSESCRGIECSANARIRLFDSGSGQGFVFPFEQWLGSLSRRPRRQPGAPGWHRKQNLWRLSPPPASASEHRGRGARQQECSYRLGYARQQCLLRTRAIRSGGLMRGTRRRA
jgi:hypothetical protein